LKNKLIGRGKSYFLLPRSSRKELFFAFKNFKERVIFCFQELQGESYFLLSRSYNVVNDLVDVIECVLLPVTREYL